MADHSITATGDTGPLPVDDLSIPANAPHQFRNNSGKTVHMLCMCTPAGQEEFFAEAGDRVVSRDSPPPQLSKEEQAERGKKAAELAPRYRIEML